MNLLKLAISIALMGLVGISLLLFLGHPGFALRVGNYFFFTLVGISLWGMIKSEN